MESIKSMFPRSCSELFIAILFTRSCPSTNSSETEWSLSGQHTSYTDLPLTEDGERRIEATGKALVGEDRLIVLNNVDKIFVSPRQRAQRTCELLFKGHEAELKRIPRETVS
jgi:probable phosphoglycerate mutase